MGKYLANGFSPAMLEKLPSSVVIDRLDLLEFCTSIYHNDEIVNAIGHDSTVMLVNVLCKTNFSKNRIEIKLNRGDMLYVVTLKERLPEGKILSDEELRQMYRDGKVEFYGVIL